MRKEGRAGIAELVRLANGVLTDGDIMNILEAKRVPAAKYEVLDACLDKIEEKAAER